jgi:hypothetical protein
MKTIGISFHQEAFLKKRKFSITEKGVECYEKEGLEETAYTVPFPEIIEAPVERSKYSKLWLTVWLFSSIFFFMDFIENYLGKGEFNKDFLFWFGVVMVYSGFQFFVTKKNLVFYSMNNLPLCFLKGVPNADAIDDFMGNVFRAQEEYFEEKYADINSNPACSYFSYADELFKLNRLREEGAIDDGEYKIAKQKLLGVIEKEEKPYTLQ